MAAPTASVTCDMPRKDTEATGSSDLLKVEAGVSPEGANLSFSVGGEVPKILDKYFPRSAARARVTRVITGRILAKISKNEPLDAADAEYAKDVLGEAEAKWIRRQEIAARAARVLEATPPPPALPAAEANDDTGDTETSDEWLNRFWEDAGLISDEMLQEIYARILASEAVRPGSCSTRTLRALRYLDRKTADEFARLAALVVDNSWVPRDLKLLREFEVSYGSLLELDDAGLIDSGLLTTRTYRGDEFFLQWHKRLLAIDISGLLIPAGATTKSIDIDCFPLRSAGRDLIRVAQVARDEHYFVKLGEWLLRRRPSLQIAWAEMPSPSREGSTGDLAWHPLPTEGVRDPDTSNVASEPRSDCDKA
ncbi:DUF2806 domain-containing protein [Sorangium sp. So ce233]|uniref:DUF2806 domain-containing protein n=1 Tax=Sorangium sp. So ce233 TaxID=3133290 RepID=UPI003F5E4288